MTKISENKVEISVALADLKPMQLEIPKSSVANCRNAETMINKLWNKWRIEFGDRITSEELMARIAFQLARRYADAFEANAEVNEFLTTFEKRLDELVVKL